VSRGIGARESEALHNLRGLAIICVVMMHSFVGYCRSAKPSFGNFAAPPYAWQAFPVVDAHRWIGFDIFCAWQDVFLMTLMFFLAGVFAWPSLDRWGAGKFLDRRCLRLAVPFLFGVGVVIPVALYPAYLVTGAPPGVSAYLSAYLRLPFWPNGPLWFLWILLALTLIAAGVHRFAPKAVRRLGALSGSFDLRPKAAFAGWALIAVFAYAPLALAFGPWRWTDAGPFSLQLCRPALYAAYFCAGLGVGERGVAGSFLSAQGALQERWRLWLAAAALSLLLWMGLTGLTLDGAAPFAVQAASDASYALAGACSVAFALAACLRFGQTRRPIVRSLSDHALGIYLIHYAFTVWLQYALLGADLPAVAKAGLVLLGALSFSWGLAVAASAIRETLVNASAARPLVRARRQRVSGS